MKKPIIGISLDLQNDNEEYSYAKFPWYALRANYADAVSDAGGFPIMLPFDESAIGEALDLIDALIVPGGDWDIDPTFFGQKIMSDTVLINHRRTTYDMKLMKKALERDMPVLGICYGMQLMNVLAGGNLIQDLPSFRRTDINHEQPHPKDALWHDINIVKGTKLWEIAGRTTFARVNSTHHQAIDQIGKNIIVTANASDGIIEAIESTIHHFAIGVEWHPEYQSIDLDKNIFKELIKASRK
jgi:putative glutamine amidotransferase